MITVTQKIKFYSTQQQALNMFYVDCFVIFNLLNSLIIIILALCLEGVIYFNTHVLFLVLISFFSN